MKGSRIYILVILLFLVIVFAIEYHLPKEFVWEPTYSHFDKQPFGCAVFDSILTTSLPNGYSITKKTFYQLSKEKTTSKRGILMIGNSMDFSKTERQAMFELAKQGNKIMLVGTDYDIPTKDTMNFVINSFENFSITYIKKYNLQFKRDSVYWIGDKSHYQQQLFTFLPQVCSPYFIFKCKPVIPGRILSVRITSQKTNNDSTIALESSKIVYKHVDKQIKRYSYLIAFARPWGKGEIIFVSTPLIFTNYGMLDKHNATYIFRMLSQMKEMPIVRIDPTINKLSAKESSPLRFLLRHTPLRWATYLTLLAIVLFMCFTARRRQRVIPVMKRPDNKSLEFTKLIGTLYYQKKDYNDLLRKKFVYFAEELRRNIRVDVENEADDEHLYTAIAQKTGIEADEIRSFFKQIRVVTDEEYTVSEEEMKSLIDKMNNILKHI
jgi:hypothetical protein